MGICTAMHWAPESSRNHVLYAFAVKYQVSFPGPTPSCESAKAKCSVDRRGRAAGTFRSSGGRAAYSRGPRTAWRSWVAMVAAVLFSQSSSWSFVYRGEHSRGFRVPAVQGGTFMEAMGFSLQAHHNKVAPSGTSVSQPCIFLVTSSFSLLFSSRTWHLHFKELLF